MATFIAAYGAYIAVAATVAAAAVSTYAAVQQSQAAADAAEDQGRVTAELARRQAEAIDVESEQRARESELIAQRKLDEAKIIADTAAFDERQQRRRIALALGGRRAATAASGVAIDVGTPLIQEIDLVQQGELEALTIQRAGAIAINERGFESGLSRYEAEATRISGRFASSLARFEGETQGALLRRRAGAIRSQIPLQIASGAASAVSSGFGAYYTTQYARQPKPSALRDISFG